MSSANSITNEAQRFQASVKKLSKNIKEAGVNWSDDKYQDLSNLVAQIASNSKCIMVAADRFTSSVEKFESLSKKTTE